MTTTENQDKGREEIERRRFEIKIAGEFGVWVGHDENGAVWMDGDQNLFDGELPLVLSALVDSRYSLSRLQEGRERELRAAFDAGSTYATRLENGNEERSANKCFTVFLASLKEEENR